MKNNPLLRQLPKTDRLLNDPDIMSFYCELSRKAVLTILRDTLDAYRLQILSNPSFPNNETDLFDQIKKDALRRLHEKINDRLKRVINATGVVLHTNLGRAPMAEPVWAHMRETALGYCNLEYATSDGKRRDRNFYIESLLTELTGAEAALAVNNNAAAVYLALHAMCSGREVIVSRGEIVEIGDSFRIMDIIESSGCLVREAGTTNRTRISDYEKQLNEKTGVLLKVHRSNFKITGFTEDTGTGELANLRKKYPDQDLAVLEDMGSGLLTDLSEYGLTGERCISDAIREGADIVTFSGDKLLGGPQAGIIVGKKEWVERMRRHPLYRCLRMDKLCLAGLEATLMAYARGQFMLLPALRYLLTPVEQIRARAEALCGMLAGTDGLHIVTGPHAATPGGGARPGETLESFAVYITAEATPAHEIERRLRHGKIPVIGLVQDNAVVLDLRTVEADDLPYIAQLLKDSV